jgi:cytochrome P450
MMTAAEDAMKTLKDIPTLPSEGFDGHAFAFRRERGDLFVRAQRTCGDLGRLRFFHQSLLALNAPEPIHEVMVEHARVFPKSLAIRMAFFFLAGKGLFTSEGDLWKRQRKLMSPMFQPAVVRGYGGSMSAVIGQYLDGWKDGAVLDMGREMTRITMAVVGKVLFDSDTFDDADELGAAIQVLFRHLGDQGGSAALIARATLGLKLLELGALPVRAEALREQAIERISMPLRLPTRGSRELYGAVAKLDDKVRRMIDERRRVGVGVARPDLLSRLLAAHDDDGSVMTDRQIRDEAVTLFVAGHETTATSTTWALYFLARHPEVYDRWKAEVAALGGGVSIADDAPRLGYTLAVFKEALRLYPPAFLLDRVSAEDVEVSGHLVPRGTPVLVCPYALHRRPELWPEPERFDPDRFTPEAEAARPRLSWLPFGAGPRVCIGAQFASLEAQLILAQIAQRFELEPASDAPVAPNFERALRPAKPVLIRVHRAS